ncbi:MAG: ABC transporter substrate-binding protein, partial [Candidatus Hodarchaeota archaeon]
MKKRVGLILGVFMMSTILGVFLSAFPVSGQQTGGIVTYAWLEDTRVMNPWTISTTWEAYIAMLVYDSLWETDPETLIVEPLLCHTWEKADADGKEWLVSIYDNATFHDGHPLTVEDIVFNWMFAKYAGTYRTALIETYLESVTIVNSTTVKFTLNQVYAPFPIGMDFFIVKTEDWDDFVVNWSGDVSNMTEPWIIDTTALLAEDMLGTDDPLQGTGGFKWIKRIPGQFIELDANPDYWHPRFQPRVDKLVMRIISNPAAQLL